MSEGNDAGIDPPVDPHWILLQVVQAYLKQRLQAEAPTAVLSLYWDDFFRLYAPIVAGLINRHVPNAQEREDLFQEVWMTVTRRLPAFQWRENRGGLRAWLTTVIRNRTIDLVRQRASGPVVNASEGPAVVDVAVPDDTGRLLDQEWRAEAVNVVVEDLRPAIGEINYQIVRLHYWDGLTAGQIAERCGLNEGQVTSRLHRSLVKMRRRLDALGFA
jgi:RNA polymerase sigma-70 factor (ECF subfamily)